MTPVQLPEVPAPMRLNGNSVYTAAQLREYATEDRANVLAAILAIIPGGSICDPQQIADDIRALLTQSETNSER